MKVAVMISGQPRFTRDFDLFLSKLNNQGQTDFFFLLWDTPPANSNIIPPTWSSNIDIVREKIINNLPSNSNIARLEVVTPPPFAPTKEYRLTPWTNHSNMWYMFYGIKQVNVMREEYEQLYGKYDLVIRARPDVGFVDELKLENILEYITVKPKSIIVPDNHRHGIGISINDLVGIGSSETMSIYAGVFDYLDQYHDSNVPFHNETLLGHHLTVNNIDYSPSGINVYFRHFHSPPHKIDYGSWA